MAYDEFTVTVTLRARGNSYELNDTETWDNHFHRNTNAPSVLKSIMDQLRQGYRLNDGVDVIEGYVNVDVIMNPDEEANYHELREAEHRAYEREADIVDQLGSTLDIRACTWSMGNKKLLANERFAEGEVRFDYDGGWGGEVKGEVLTNPTYQDLWRAADRAVLLSGDSHHCFLEAARLAGTLNGVEVYELSFGS